MILVQPRIQDCLELFLEESNRGLKERLTYHSSLLEYCLALSQPKQRMHSLASALCLSVYLSTWLSVCPSICPYIYSTLCISSLQISFSLSIRLSVYASVIKFLCLSSAVFLWVRSSVSLSGGAGGKPNERKEGRKLRGNGKMAKAPQNSSLINCRKWTENHGFGSIHRGLKRSAYPKRIIRCSSILRFPYNPRSREDMDHYG